MTKSRGILPPRQRWTDDQVATLIKLYPDTSTESIAKQLGCTIERVYSKASLLGLKKSEVYLDSPAACRLRKGDGDGVGASTRFQKGEKPWNAGQSYQPGGRSAETQFKKGERRGRANKLYQPIGAERISRDGYLERKINDDMPLQRRWRAVHILNWEAINGPLPKGHALVFKDGNKQNTAPENLELLSRAELMRRNSFHTNYPKEVGQLVQLRGAITRQINKRNKS